MQDHVIDLNRVARSDVARVGGKNASLGEMIRALGGVSGIKVPPGFATTAEAYRAFLRHNDLTDRMAAAAADREASLAETGRAIRALILGGDWPPDIADAIRTHYTALCDKTGIADLPVAVRSSATAEDLPEASFAGQQETVLNVRGSEALLDACRRCYASLFTDRAIAYRQNMGFAQDAVALSVGVQQMVHAETGGSGVMFSIDTETGCPDIVLINAAWGLGETVVQGIVDPDEYQVYKPFLGDAGLSPIIEKRLGAKEVKMICAPDGTTAQRPTAPAERMDFVLRDPDILELARQARRIEAHYGQPMDIEWARDGDTGIIYIVQARPETVQSRAAAGLLHSYRVKPRGPELLRGLSVGAAAAAGQACVIDSAAAIDRFVEGAILVTPTTDPDWVPIMKRAAAIVTDHGGRTSHAAIVSRELGLPAIVGAGSATERLRDGQDITVSCAEGSEGIVYDGLAEISRSEQSLATLPETRTEVMLNLANPAAATRWWQLPAKGVGLARMEFVITTAVRVHPMALARFDLVEDAQDQTAIEALTRGYDDKGQYFVDRLALGLARIAAVMHPRPVIVRMSDFKTNEYADLLGGRAFEPVEANPMLGFRGAARYYSDRYRAGFALECRAIARLRDVIGFDNVVVMIPFCRTPEEADRVLDVMAENGLVRGRGGLQVYVMCEIPSNVIRAAEFAERFDGFSIGSNDLTQLTLGVDRDSEALADLFRETDPAVMWMIEHVIGAAHKAGVKVGFCGQAPSNDPEFARRLVALGIDSISVTPDSFVSVLRNVAEAEKPL